MSLNRTNTPRIAIIGGGPGGLILLLTLHRRGVSATLYERDTSFSTRAHLGGSLDLGWTSGQRALRENGLQDEFTDNSRPEGEETKIYDASGKIHLHHGIDEHGPPSKTSPNAPPTVDPLAGEEDIRPEIDRTVLRQIIFDAVPATSIKWDHALTSACALADGQHELTFANGTTATCDLLVGADGANSRVRPLLSPATPIYTGVTGVEIWLSPSVVALPLAHVVAAVGAGTMMAMQNNRILASQVNGDGRIRTFAFFREDEDFALPLGVEAVRTLLLERYEGWAEWMQVLIERCDEEAIYARRLETLPVGHRWAHVGGVTLLGDAAHLMTPFAGAGANLAMLDGLELGIALAELVKGGKFENRDEVDAAIAGFEESMCARAGRVSRKSLDHLNACVHPDAPAFAIARFQALVSEGIPREG